MYTHSIENDPFKGCVDKAILAYTWRLNLFNNVSIYM